MSISIPSLDDFTYQAPKNPIPGVSYVGRKKIKLSNVDTDNQLNKKARVDGVVNNHVNALKESFAGGIDTSAPLPVVEQGELENHLSVDFFHRSKAFEELGITEYVFDVYEFANEFSKISFQLYMNDHKPAGAAKPADIIAAAVELIENPECELTRKESVIKKWVNSVAKHKHSSTRGSIVKKICQQTKTRQAVVTYSKKDLNKFYNSWLPDRTKGGMIDMVRDMYGYDVTTKYEGTKAIGAIKKLKESGGKKSYFVLHTDSPEKNKDIPIMRRDMINAFQNAEESLKYFVKWYNKHKCMPWEIVGFLPQIDGENEKKLIPVDKI